jgi:hypothetical protein
LGQTLHKVHLYATGLFGDPWQPFSKARRPCFRWFSTVLQRWTRCEAQSRPQTEMHVRQGMSAAVLTYAGLYAVDLFVPEPLGAFLDAALVVAAFGAITTNLLSSIGRHLISLGLRQAQ